MKPQPPTRRPSLSVIVAGAILAAACVGPISAQTATETPFTDRLDVSLVNVEVWVTDRQGKPVTGLLADDFEVFEDGEPVEVTHFAEYDADAELARFTLEDPTASQVRPGTSPSEEASTTPEEAVADASDAESPEGYLVIYLDEIHSGPVGRKRLIKDLRSFFETDPVPIENVLILRQTNALFVEMPFGSSEKEFRKALDRMKKTTSRGQQTWADDQQAIRRLQDLWEQETIANNSGPGGDPCIFFAPRAFREVQTYVNVTSARVRETLDHLTNAATFLSGVAGPKTLLYLSDGLIMAPGISLMAFVRSLCPGEGVFESLDVVEGLNAEYREMTRHAAANRVTFYTLQTSGLHSSGSLSSADQRGLANMTRAISRYDSDNRQGRREGLALLAAETGGRSIFNRNEFLEELEQVGENMRGYYSLAYVPRHGGDGLEHRIEVRLVDRKHRIRHRPGYRDKSADQRMVEQLESTLFLNVMANPLGARLGVGSIRPDDKKYTVPLHVRVPTTRLTFLPQKDGELSKLSVRVLARNDKRKRTAMVQQSFDVPQPSEPGADIAVVVPLELEEGIHVLAVGIRDEASLETSFISTGIQLQPTEETDG